MPRTRKPIKVKEPIRLRTKELANGSKSLYLDIYRNGKRTYEYLKINISSSLFLLSMFELDGFLGVALGVFDLDYHRVVITLCLDAEDGLL